MKSKFIAALSFLLFFAILFTGCAPSTPNSVKDLTEIPEDETEVETEVPTEVIEEPTEEAAIEALPCTIAFQSDRDGSWEIYSMLPDGTNLINLTNNPADDIDPAFSPDGSRIAFVSNRVVNDQLGQFIFVMNADGSDVRKLPTVDGSQNPSWAPNGEVIVYDNGNDIFIINADGSEGGQLTETPEKDVQPDFSPEDDFIVWISGDDGNANILVMDLRTMEVQQITPENGVSDAQWTVDAEIFFHGDGYKFGCFNCVMAADGTDIRDAGGKGTIQEFIPFWTMDGDRVECVHGVITTEDDEIYLVSDIYEDIFLNLTNDPGNDQNPTWPENCGSSTESSPETSVPVGDEKFVIGYEDADGVMTDLQKEDLEQACSELPIACVQDDFDALIEQGVDAIISFSSRWHVMGSAPQIYDAVGKDIPVFVLGAESDAPGAYNLSNDSAAIQETLSWMFKQMGGTGELIYFVFGQNAIHQEIVDSVLAENPGITATQIAAEFGDDTVTWENIKALMEEYPNVNAFWTDENVPELLIAVSGVLEGQPPYIPCEARDDRFEMWQQTLESNPQFQCIATVNPGGTAYEGIYAAYYILTGHEINPDALGGHFGNTFLYNFPVVTNENLDDFLTNKGNLRMNDWGGYELAPMTPDEILEIWFIN